LFAQHGLSVGISAGSLEFAAFRACISLVVGLRIFLPATPTGDCAEWRDLRSAKKA